MRILTVRQPWAWAIIHGGKDVENRVRNIAGDYRGPVAIHVGLAYDTAWSSPSMYDAMQATGVHRRPGVYPWHEGHGAIIGVVELVDVHFGPFAEGWNPETERIQACSPWAERDVFHLVLANPRPLAEPIPFRGALGLRTLDPETIERIYGRLPDGDSREGSG